MLRLAGLLAGVAAAFAAAPDRCPAGYTAFQGRCFKYNASPQNWANSQAQCQLEDANLASFADQDDFDFLWALCVGNECWLGGNDIASEGTFRFVGSNALVLSGYWSTGEPDNFLGNQDCIWMWLAAAPDPKIDDLQCTASRRFLCERPTGCGAGEYRANANTCTNCPAGKYQPSISVNGISDCIDCAAGRYGTAVKETNPACTGICAQGYYCPPGSTSPTANDCPAGKYGATTGLGTATCSGNVGPGYWSTTRATRVNPTSVTAHRGDRCPAGRFGAGGASSSSCSGPCQAGYYCPIGSGSASQTQCGGPDKYCPAGRGSPISVSSGYYSTPESAPSTQRTGQAKCSEEEFCSGGVRTKRIVFCV